MVEDLLAARSIIVSHETVRPWAEKFGRDFAGTARRRARKFDEKWHSDEVVITISGQKHWLWRAVDQDGFVLDALIQSRRARTAPPQPSGIFALFFASQASNDWRDGLS